MKQIAEPVADPGVNRIIIEAVKSGHLWTLEATGRDRYGAWSERSGKYFVGCDDALKTENGFRLRLENERTG